MNAGRRQYETARAGESHEIENGHYPREQGPSEYDRSWLSCIAEEVDQETEHTEQAENRQQ